MPYPKVNLCKMFFRDNRRFAHKGLIFYFKISFEAINEKMHW